jgi:hypothetical protein
MEADGVQAFYDHRTGQTTIFPENIEVGEGETPLRAVARIILHERPARNLLEMISAKPLYLNTKKGRNWLRTAGLQLPGARGFQSGQTNLPNEAGVVNLAKSQAPKLARPGQRSRQRPHLLSRPARPDRTDHLVLLRKLHLPPPTAHHPPPLDPPGSLRQSGSPLPSRVPRPTWTRTLPSSPTAPPV